jgi:hypothetical protein
MLRRKNENSKLKKKISNEKAAREDNETWKAV